MMMGQNLKKIMKEKGITVVSLSRDSGVPAKTIYHWSGGQRPRNIEQVFKICDVLGITIDELYGRPNLRTESVEPFTVERIERELHAGTFEVILRPIARE